MVPGRISLGSFPFMTVVRNSRIRSAILLLRCLRFVDAGWIHANRCKARVRKGRTHPDQQVDSLGELQRFFGPAVGHVGDGVSLAWLGRLRGWTAADLTGTGGHIRTT